MNFFKRKQANGVPATTETTTTHHREKRGPTVMNMSSKPSFGQWLKVTWLDIFTMAAMGMIGLGVSFSPNLSSFDLTNIGLHG